MIVYSATPCPLVAKPEAVATAFNVSVVATLTGVVYGVDDGVAGVPSVVKKIEELGVLQEIVTD